MNSKLVVAVIGLSLLLVACGKKEQTASQPTSGTQTAARAQWVMNVSVDASAKQQFDYYYGVTSDICAQIVVPASGSNSGQSVLEVSGGTCPNSLVDNTSRKVATFTFRAVGSSNMYEIYDAQYGVYSGVGQWSSIADRDARRMTKINSLCTEAREYCFMEAEAGVLKEIVF